MVAQVFQLVQAVQLVVIFVIPGNLRCCCRQMLPAIQCLALFAWAQGEVCGMHAGSLLKLTINGNQLTAIAPECGQLTNLRELHLQGNQLTELPTQLYQLTVSFHLHTDMMWHTAADIT